MQRDEIGVVELLKRRLIGTRGPVRVARRAASGPWAEIARIGNAPRVGGLPLWRGVCDMSACLSQSGWAARHASWARREHDLVVWGAADQLGAARA